MPPIPISIEGFSGEGLEVLKFDLYVQGFSVVPASPRAQYHISDSDGGNVIGRLSNSGKELFARSYAGRNLRERAHSTCR